MLIRVLSVFAVAVFLSGCATTQNRASVVNQLEKDMTDIQQRMEEQEKEIVELKYEMKELSGRSDASVAIPFEESTLVPDRKPQARPSADSRGFIKVDVSETDIQKALKGAGLYDGKIDGKIGSRTKAAIMEFQRQHNLKADGVIGQKTWNELKTYLTE